MRGRVVFRFRSNEWNGSMVSDFEVLEKRSSLCFDKIWIVYRIWDSGQVGVSSSDGLMYDKSKIQRVWKYVPLQAVEHATHSNYV